MARSETRTIPASRSTGFTLIEMIIFIVIVGIAAMATLLPLTNLLEDTPAIYSQAAIEGVANTRMEAVIGYRRSYTPRLYGFVDTALCEVASRAYLCELNGYSIDRTTLLGSNSIYIFTSTFKKNGPPAYSLQTQLIFY